MSEVKINDVSYFIGKLNAKKQSHLVKRLTPLLTGIGSAIANVNRMASTSPPQVEAEESNEAEPKPKRVMPRLSDFDPMEIIVAALGPAGEAISKISDADLDFIIDTCLSVVKVHDKFGAWSDILSSNGRYMFPAIENDLGLTLELTINVLRENLSNFFVSSLRRYLPGALD